MMKRSIFTTITPLPSYITRETVIEALHQHSEMIELNPLVIKHVRCKPPGNAPSDEFHCVWYELTDKIHYLPGGILSGNVSYKACFHDLPRGLQTHVYAPTGLDIKEKWSVGGNMPGEPREPIELGLLDVPREGLYLREDVDMRSNILTTSFVKRTLKKAHSVLVERLIVKADLLKQRYEDAQRQSFIPRSLTYPLTETDSHRGSIYSPPSPGFQTTRPDQIPPPIVPRLAFPDDMHLRARASCHAVSPGPVDTFRHSHYIPPKQAHIVEIDSTPVYAPRIGVGQADIFSREKNPAVSTKRAPVIP
ncbi:uncharacterized protein CIMG_09404 [Coccidioides immitis RS]|uniref:DUF7053 domain-containing protein n=4 Tax=Coccidioides immitis TaxID=5501 RepID=J3K2A1_COCIM|nr:uncharacterized protein CIMG_09404 [Coccidioides immitis RS]EAS28200.3 hypothetical protein CIMG_09404 [Coccidioides immitis RS]KMU77949.1 hypothetical protein CISG_06859 [Coccidioides immitis RMSCC 3703]TPX20853.1 hypothetical protein DIZ76_016750 [Coccidioides immitis]